MALFDKLAITSPDIQPLARVPDVYAADTGNQTPTLGISGVPEGTVELALIMHDPDAPLPNGFTHWTVYGIPADTTTIDETVGRVGPNTLGDQEYSGPQPPPGHGTHHYYFWVFALNQPVQDQPSREEFLTTYADSILEQARLVGLYSAD